MKKITAWMATKNGKIIHEESLFLDYRIPCIYFNRGTAYEAFGEWNFAQKKKNRRWILEKGIKIIKVNIIIK